MVVRRLSIGVWRRVLMMVVPVPVIMTVVPMPMSVPVLMPFTGLGGEAEFAHFTVHGDVAQLGF